MDIVKIAPENLEVANAYLSTGSALIAAEQLGVTPDVVYAIIEKSDVKSYMDQVYLDQGYRNRFKLAELLDEITENKIAEARESEVYTSKDLVDIIQLQHKIATDHAKTTTTKAVTNQTNNQLNVYGDGNYGKLMEKLLGDGTE